MKYFLKIFLCIFLSMLGIELLFKLILFNNFGFEFIRIILFTLQISLLFSIIISFMKELPAKIITVILVFISGLYTFIQLSFKSFMGNFMSLGMLKAGDATRVDNEFSTFMASIEPINYLCLLPFIILIIIFIFKKLNYQKKNKINNIILISSFIVVSILSYLSLNIKNSNQLKSNIDLYKNPTILDISLREFGTNRFLIRDLNKAIIGGEEILIQVSKPQESVQETSYSRKFDDTDWLEIMNNEKNKTIANLHQYYMNQSITDKNEYTGLFKDKNLILIMVEALDLSIISETLTPTLYRLTKEGWYFDNYYAPKFSCTTGESEFIALTSIIPSIQLCTPHAYADNTYPTSIFNLFNKSGYTSTSYHGWDDKYYPRTKLHKNMGSTFYNSDDLNFSTSGGWTSDLQFMNRSYDMFKDQDKFFSFMITVSMHFSYDFSDATVRKNWDKVKDLDTGTPMKRYLAKAIEFDLGLESLINSLEKDGKLDDTVIVIFGDHHPYNLKFSYLNDFSNVDRYEDLNEDLLPFIIYSHDQEPKVISKTASTYDILPTLANLFDLDYDPRYYVGKDIFSNEESIAIFPNGNWVTDQAIYFANKNTYKKKNENVTDEYIEKINKIVNDKFTASDNTLEKDYFKYRFPN